MEKKQIALNIVKQTLKDRYKHYKETLLKEGTTLQVDMYGSFNNPKAYLYNEETKKHLEIYLPQGYLYIASQQDNNKDFMNSIDCYEDDELIYITLTKELIKESLKE